MMVIKMSLDRKRAEEIALKFDKLEVDITADELLLLIEKAKKNKSTPVIAIMRPGGFEYRSARTGRKLTPPGGAF